MTQQITIPLSTAQEHFVAASQRGFESGKLLENQRIIRLLKEKGMYDAIVVIKSTTKTKGN